MTIIETAEFAIGYSLDYYDLAGDDLAICAETEAQNGVEG
jgi:hypothetical protein